HCIKFLHHRQHLTAAPAVGLSGVEEFSTRMRPASDLDHVAASENSVVAVVGIGLQIAFESIEPVARPGAGSIRRVLKNIVRIALVPEETPDPPALAFSLHRLVLH